METGVARETLAAIGRALTTVPAGFGLNPKMVQQLARRAKMAEGALPLDWGTAEALAFGSLVLEGTPIRVSGQDSSRGTFSQRHASSTTRRPARPGRRSRRSIRSRPTSRPATARSRSSRSWVSTTATASSGPRRSSSGRPSSATSRTAPRSSWTSSSPRPRTSGGRRSRMGLLLPHGSEGQGPEHSSARIERYLQLCADGNMQVCNATNPAQYFHLLRRQMRQPLAKPLDPLHAQEPAPAAGGRLAARVPDDRRIPRLPRRPRGRRPRSRRADPLLQRQGLLRPARREREARRLQDRDRPPRTALPVPEGTPRRRSPRAIRRRPGRSGSRKSRRNMGAWSFVLEQRGGVSSPGLRDARVRRPRRLALARDRKRRRPQEGARAAARGGVRG